MLGGLISGAVDYIKDPTGMGAYRDGLKAQEAAQRAELEAMRGRMEGLAEGAQNTYNQTAQMYQPLANLVPGAIQGLQQDYSVTPQEYQYNRSVESFLDPSIAFQQQQAQRGIESSAAARGNLMSGAAAKAIADRAQQIGAQGYSDAYARMERDRQYGAGQAQQNYMNQVAQGQQQYGQAQNLANIGLSGLANQVGAMQQGANMYANMLTPSYSEMINPTAGMGDMAAGQMRGGFTKGLMDMGADLIKAKMSVPPTGKE